MNQNEYGDVEIVGLDAAKEFDEEFPAGTTITLIAWPRTGRGFYGWSDEVRDKTREIVVNSDIELVAMFV